MNEFNNQIIFFDFCPSVDFSKRRIDGRARGIFEFQCFESKVQVKGLATFATIEIGDLIVLKKRQVIGKTMRVYGYGLVTGITKDNKGNRVLKVDWSSQEQVIEVPLMGCNATIDIRDSDKVRAEMPAKFFEWLNHGAGVSNSTKPAPKSEAIVPKYHEIDEGSEYNNLNPEDFETLAFSFLWVGNHIGEAAGGMSVKERMSALYACDEILSSQSSDADTSEKELFISVLKVVGGDNAQLLLDAYNADPRSTEQGLKDTVRILTEYSESGQSGVVEQSTFFMNALVKMAKAVIDESEVSTVDMKERIKAFDVVKDLMCKNLKPSKLSRKVSENVTSNTFKNPSLGQKTTDKIVSVSNPSNVNTKILKNKKSNTFKNQSVGENKTDKIKSKSNNDNNGCFGCGIFVVIIIFFLYLLVDNLIFSRISDAIQELQQQNNSTQNYECQSEDNITFKEAHANAKNNKQEIFYWKKKKWSKCKAYTTD